MKPEVNSNIKLFFKNGLQVEGKVHSWGKEIVLATDNSQSFMVVTRPKEIMMYKLIVNMPEAVEEINTINYRGVDSFPEEIEDEVIQDEVIIKDESMSPEYMRLLSLAELHKMKIQEDRISITEKLKSYSLGEVKPASYTNQLSLPCIKK